MSTLIRLSGVTLPGTDYPKLLDFIPLALPVAAGLVGLYRFGSSIEESRRNFANPGEPLTVVGSPVIKPIGALLDNANCFNTSLKSTAAITILSVAKMMHVTSSIAGAALVTSQAQDGATVRGDDLYINGTTVPERRVSLSVGHETGSASVHCNVTGTIAGEWNFFAGRVNEAAEAQTGHARAGLPMTWSAQTDVGVRQVSATRNLRIGGAYFLHSGATEHALVAIFDRALTTSEVEQNLSYLRSIWAPAVGITTL